MKIDEKYLDEKERVAKTFITDTTYEDIALRELEEVRLMRLGLEFEEFKKSRTEWTGYANWKALVKLGQWAQEHAIPAMKPGIVIEDTCEECGTFKAVRYEIQEIKEALKLLPKGD